MNRRSYWIASPHSCQNLLLMTTRPSMKSLKLDHPVILFYLTYCVWVSKSLCHRRRVGQMTLLKLIIHLYKVKKEGHQGLYFGEPRILQVLTLSALSLCLLSLRKSLIHFMVWQWIPNLSKFDLRPKWGALSKVLLWSVKLTSTWILLSFAPTQSYLSMRRFVKHGRPFRKLCCSPNNLFHWCDNCID